MAPAYAGAGTVLVAPVETVAQNKPEIILKAGRTVAEKPLAEDMFILYALKRVEEYAKGSGVPSKQLLSAQNIKSTLNAAYQSYVDRFNNNPRLEPQFFEHPVDPQSVQMYRQACAEINVGLIIGTVTAAVIQKMGLERAQASLDAQAEASRNAVPVSQ